MFTVLILLLVTVIFLFGPALGQSSILVSGIQVRLTGTWILELHFVATRL